MKLATLVEEEGERRLRACSSSSILREGVEEKKRGEGRKKK